MKVSHGTYARLVSNVCLFWLGYCFVYKYFFKTDFFLEKGLIRKVSKTPACSCHNEDLLCLRALACGCVCVCVCVCVLSGLLPAQWVEQRGVDVTLYYDNLFNLFLSLAQQFRFMFRNMFVFSQKSFTFVFPEWRRVLLLCLCVSACLSVSLAPLLLLVIIILVTSIVTSTLPLNFFSLSLHNCLLFGLVVSSCSFVYLFSADRVSKS